jgi:poly(A) polymerase/tRNA nucleotidyltransferase (CCA-adding enzyme)
MTDKIKIPKFIKPLANVFRENDFQCYLVGGAVRNMALGKKAVDFDIATDASPEDVSGMFRTVIPTGIKHGTVTVFFRHKRYEITTFRIEGDYINARRPGYVKYTPSILEDLKRRDFTINAMAVDCYTGEILDPHNGIEDLERKTIRAIGNPCERFSEDGLRLIRAVRFAAQLSFIIEPNTLQGIKDCRNSLKQVSMERIRDEFEKIILSDHPSYGLELLDDTGILKMILPELAACKGVEQKGIHELDVFYHSLYTCDRAPKTTELKLAALLHDIGKPMVMNKDPKTGIPSFHGHETAGEEAAHKIIRRFKFPVKTEKKCCHLIRNHMFHYEESWTDAAVRRFISRVGVENLGDLFALRSAETYSADGKTGSVHRVQEFHNRIKDVLDQDNALSLKDLAVDGNELHTEAGIPKGPEMGKVLNFLFEAVLEDPEQNRKDRLLQMGKLFYQERVLPDT